MLSYLFKRIIEVYQNEDVHLVIFSLTETHQVLLVRFDFTIHVNMFLF